MQCVTTNEMPTFNQYADCSQATFQSYRAGANGSGSGEFVLFGGNDPNGEDWGCGPLATATRRVDTCYVRLTTGTITNTAYNEFFAIRFAGESSSVSSTSSGPSRAPVIVAAAVAVAALGAGALVLRRRTRSTSVV